ncbi:asparaginase [Fulvivirgaceae bacterium BMA10]|uniref:asparaginase n=1 Tax=Splendidivirga corallicola TaxID=3051826 RepID=A0ABT8KTW1_9BACT|nr:asparaginase [Fulvivirgaceae bacterium BMA10]
MDNPSNYKIINIRSDSGREPKASVLLIYTGGTIGMSYDESGSLVPFNFGHIIEKISYLKGYNLKITAISFPKPIDSSNIKLDHWNDLAYIIYENYDSYDGFVVLHGTDTMAYSASALSFMLEGLNKPVIFTGAQLPIGAARSDARENLITALDIASLKKQNRSVVSEVCIYFNYLLLRGNRSKKVESQHFNAFESENYPPLAEAGVEIDYNYAALKPYLPDEQLGYKKIVDTNVAILKIFPGMTPQVVESILSIEGLKGVVMETYGAGNAPSESWFFDYLERAIKKDIIIFNVSQCMGGKVIQGRYQTSKTLDNIGVLSGNDITTEAAITKMMYLFSNRESSENIRKRLVTPLRGEMTETNFN